MRIEGFDDKGEDSEILSILSQMPDLDYKFVLIRTIDDIVGHVFIGIRHTIVLGHLGVLDRPESFIGAGRGKGLEIGWSSDSCEEHIALKRDRPTDSAEADRLLAEFREAMQALLSHTEV